MLLASCNVTHTTAIPSLYTVNHKTCHFVFEYNSGVSWSIFTIFVSVETIRNTLQHNLMLWWRHSISVTMHVAKVYFIQLALKIKYVEFEDRPIFYFKSLWECESVSARRLIKEFSATNWKVRTLDDFLSKLRTTGSIERTVMITDFKMCCLYVVGRHS